MGRKSFHREEEKILEMVFYDKDDTRRYIRMKIALTAQAPNLKFILIRNVTKQTCNIGYILTNVKIILVTE